MAETPNPSTFPEADIRDFYLRCMEVLEREGVPFLVGGAFAIAAYTGILRQTKDLDLFIRAAHVDRALGAFEAAGYGTERTWPHFLVKALHDRGFVDLLHNSGNGLCPVDDEWFANAVPGPVLGRVAPVCAPEEMIWSKAYVQERDRYDGADIAHLILARGETMDWDRLMNRFRGHEQVLTAHLVLFGYIYPSHADRVPQRVIDELLVRAENEPAPNQRVCRGTNLSQSQYLPDIRERGYLDARLHPLGPLDAEHIRSMMPGAPPPISKPAVPEPSPG